MAGEVQRGRGVIDLADGERGRLRLRDSPGCLRARFFIIVSLLRRRMVIAVIRQREIAEGRGRGAAVGVVVGVAQTGRGVVVRKLRGAEDVVVRLVQAEGRVVVRKLRCAV